MDDRREDKLTRDRIDILEEQMIERYDKAYNDIKKKLASLQRILRLIVVVLFLTAILAGYLYNDNRGRAERIQKSRIANIISSCRESNARNVNTKKVLDDVYDRAVKAGKVKTKDVAASKQFTILLIDALSPHRNCEALAKNRIDNTSPTIPDSVIDTGVVASTPDT